LVVSLVYALFCRLFELVVLLARGERSKELEILVLRHQLSILHRQVNRPRFTSDDRLLLTALSPVLPRRSWGVFLVRPETLLRWHRRLVAAAGAMSGSSVSCASSGSMSRPRWCATSGGVRASRRRHSVARRAGVRFCAITGQQCSPATSSPSDTVLLRRLYVLVFICVGSRRIEYVACTSNPDGAWMLQQARNLLMNLDDRGRRPRFLIHDRDTKFGRAFDAIFDTEGVRVIRTPVRAPHANAHVERWVGSARRECLDRLLIFTRRQLEHVLRLYVRHYNEHRAHRSLDLEAPDPQNPVPALLAKIGLLEVVETETFPAEGGRGLRQGRSRSPTGQAGGRTARPPAHRARSFRDPASVPGPL
jgi:putative transposase